MKIRNSPFKNGKKNAAATKSKNCQAKKECITADIENSLPHLLTLFRVSKGDATFEEEGVGDCADEADGYRTLLRMFRRGALVKELNG